MYEINLKGVDPTQWLTPISYGDFQTDMRGRPISIPHLEPGEFVLGEFDQAVLTKWLVCDQGLTDMQGIWDSYAKGYAVGLNWYKAVILDLTGGS